MAEEGVAGLSLSAVARRMGIQLSSLYKYFPSKLAVYDALFQRGAREALTVFRAATAGAEPGWAALTAGYVRMLPRQDALRGRAGPLAAARPERETMGGWR